MIENKSGVSLHIERVVLDGMPLTAGSVAQLQMAMQTELTQLLSQDGLVHVTQGAMHSVTAPSFQIVGDSVPQLGRQIARSVYQSLNRSA